MGKRSGSETSCFSLLFERNFGATSEFVVTWETATKQSRLMRGQKGVMISHRNVISNVLQHSTYDQKARSEQAREIGKDHWKDILMGLLPFSHIYGLVLIVHASVWRGDHVVVLPKFEQKSYFETIHHYRCTALYVVSLDLTLSHKQADRPNLRCLQSSS